MEKDIGFAIAFAVCPLSTLTAAEPLPYVEIKEVEMPQYIDVSLMQFDNTLDSSKAIALYHQLRKSFELSNKTMGIWLGVKRRSLYNWMNEPESAIKYGKQIEYRLVSLAMLADDMEPVHLPLLGKIAFSPIYGDPLFGESIINGKSSDQLLEWYDKLFPQFESYRKTLKRKSKLA